MSKEKNKLRKVVAAIAICLAGSATMFAQETGVKIGNTIWASRNVDEFGTFAEKPESYGKLYQWNRPTAWATTGNVTGWDGTIPEGTVWEKKNDPCPNGWRVPTWGEFEEFYLEIKNGGTFTGTVDYNGTGVSGLVATYGANKLFLPAAGCRDLGNINSLENVSTGNLEYAGAGVFLWFSEQYISDSNFAYGFNFIDGTKSGRRWKNSAFSVRCVKESDNTAINEVSVAPENAVVTGYFDMLGRKLNEEPKQGLYIIRYSNGTAKKVMR